LSRYCPRVPAVSGRAVRTAIATVCAAWLGLAATYAAEPLARVAHAALARFGPSELLAWCAGLGIAAALLAFARTDVRLHRLVQRPLPRLRAVGATLASVPAGVTLPFVVAASYAVRVALDHDAAMPRVFGDELIFSGLAKSLAAGEGFEVRGAPVGLDYGALYPLLTSPIYGLAGDGATAFLSAQTLNAVAMSFAAVPAYYLARRIVSPGWSFAVAVLTVGTPAMAFTALVMTEAVFYSGFVAATLALVLALERPTRARQLAFVALVLAVAAVRVQAVVLIPALLTAILIEAARTRAGFVTSLRRFAPSWILFALIGAAALVMTRGDVREPLGAYGALVRGYAVLDVGKWFGWSIATLELSVGVVAFAALIVAAPLLLRRSSSPPEGALGAAAVAVTFWTVLSVALLSASPYGLDRLHWRNLFVVVPMVLTCLVWWLQNGLPRPGPIAVGAAAAALVLPALVPERLVTGYFPIDSPPTRPWAELMELAPSLSTWAVVAPFVALGVVTFLLARGAAFPILSVTLAFLAIAAAIDWKSELPRPRAEQLAWIDDALPKGEQVLLVHFDFAEAPCPRIGQTSKQRELVRLTEFFNTSVRRFAHVWGPLVQDGLASPLLTIEPDGSIRRKGADVHARYAVADSRVQLAGDRLARLDIRTLGGPWLPRPTGSLTLWRVEDPLRVADVTQLQGMRLAQLACRPPDTA
jgi:hypothetical protein